MMPWGALVELSFAPSDRVSLAVVDVPLARALFDGLPAARVLARVRLGSDERDLAQMGRREGLRSSWDVLLRELLDDDGPRRERVRRAIARHARAAADEGPLVADADVQATLVAATLLAEGTDASLGEVAAGRTPLEAVAGPGAVHRFTRRDDRLGDGDGDFRSVLFEAALALATRATLAPVGCVAAAQAFATLAAATGLAALPRPARTRMQPWERPGAPEGERAPGRRMVAVDRADLEVVVSRDPRSLAAAISRFERGASRPSTADQVAADLGVLLSVRGTVVMVRVADRRGDGAPSSARAPAGPPSWQPSGWSIDDAGALADAVEAGLVTLPELQMAAARGGDAALDALGAEMLQEASHPFASAVFAEVVARCGRPRDVMRLVTYFALSDDLGRAARILATCTAAELPPLLGAWLESMLPASGDLAPAGDDPTTSSAARLTASIAALAPYPHLHGAVAPLLQRISQAPPPAV